MDSHQLQKFKLQQNKQWLMEMKIVQVNQEFQQQDLIIEKKYLHFFLMKKKNPFLKELIIQKNLLNLKLDQEDNKNKKMKIVQINKIFQIFLQNHKFLMMMKLFANYFQPYFLLVWILQHTQYIFPYIIYLSTQKFKILLEAKPKVCLRLKKTTQQWINIFLHNIQTNLYTKFQEQNHLYPMFLLELLYKICIQETIIYLKVLQLISHLWLIITMLNIIMILTNLIQTDLKIKKISIILIFYLLVQDLETVLVNTWHYVNLKQFYLKFQINTKQFQITRVSQKWIKSFYTVLKIKILLNLKNYDILVINQYSLQIYIIKIYKNIISIKQIFNNLKKIISKKYKINQIKSLYNTYRLTNNLVYIQKHIYFIYLFKFFHGLLLEQLNLFQLQYTYFNFYLNFIILLINKQQNTNIKILRYKLKRKYKNITFLNNLIILLIKTQIFEILFVINNIIYQYYNILIFNENNISQFLTFYFYYISIIIIYYYKKDIKQLFFLIQNIIKIQLFKNKKFQIIKQMIFTILQTILVLIVLLVLYKIYMVLLGPYITLQNYKKKYPKSIIYKFYPILGHWKDAIQTINKDKDLATKLCELKNFSSDKDHKIKMIVSNSEEPGRLQFMLCDKDLIKEFLVTKVDLFEKRFGDLFLFDELMGQGVLMASGQKWKNQRSTISTLFHFQKIKDRVPSMLESTNMLIEKLNPVDGQYKQILENSDKNNTLMSIIQETTSRIVISAFFGSQNNLKNKTINGKQLSLEIQSLIEQAAGYGNENPSSLFRLLLVGSHDRNKVPSFFFDKQEKIYFKRADTLKEFIKSEIRIRRKQKQENNKNKDIKDFLDITLESKIADDDETICQLFITLFFAGMDTTAHLVLISLYYLSQYPEIQTLLRNEMQETFQKEEDYEVMDKYNSIQNLNKFIYEVLRIKSPTPNFLSRTALQDMYLGDFFIPKGSAVNLSFMSNNYNAKYNNDPYKFDINRPENQENINNFNFLPFSGGPRNCIGQHMALCESKIILSKILKNYKILPNHEGELAMEYLFLYSPKNKNLVQFEKL